MICAFYMCYISKPERREEKLRLAKSISISNNAALHVNSTKHIIHEETLFVPVWISERHIQDRRLLNILLYTDADFSALDF